MGSTGDSYDIALPETIKGLYKAEIIHRRGPWRTREAVELATLEWVSWVNHQRLLEPIGTVLHSLPQNALQLVGLPTSSADRILSREEARRALG